MTPTTRRVLSDCAAELFRAYGVVLREGPTGAPSLEVRDSTHTGCVVELKPGGADAHSSAGSLHFLSSFELVASAQPPGAEPRTLSPASSGDWIYVRDWTRELTNQLAGRVTNRLVTGGLLLTPGRPRTVPGEASARELRTAVSNVVSFVSTKDDKLYVLLTLPRELATIPPPARDGGVTWLDGDGHD